MILPLFGIAITALSAGYMSELDKRNSSEEYIEKGSGRIPDFCS